MQFTDKLVKNHYSFILKNLLYLIYASFQINQDTFKNYNQFQKSIFFKIYCTEEGNVKEIYLLLIYIKIK